MNDNPVFYNRDILTVVFGFLFPVPYEADKVKLDRSYSPALLPIALTSKDFLEALKQLFHLKKEPLKIFSYPQQYICSVQMVKLAISLGYDFSQGDYLCYLAALNGVLPVLEWARDPTNRHLYSWSSNVSTAAASKGHLHIVSWLRSQEPPCPWDSSACSAAVTANDLPMLKLLRSLYPPCPWSLLTTYTACELGHLPLLQWMLVGVVEDPVGGGESCPWDYRACYFAATRGGQQHVADWIARVSYPPGKDFRNERVMHW